MTGWKQYCEAGLQMLRESDVNFCGVFFVIVNIRRLLRWRPHVCRAQRPKCTSSEWSARRMMPANYYSQIGPDIYNLTWMISPPLQFWELAKDRTYATYIALEHTRITTRKREKAKTSTQGRQRPWQTLREKNRTSPLIRLLKQFTQAAEKLPNPRHLNSKYPFQGKAYAFNSSVSHHQGIPGK